ncbi:MAG: 30S ribosome-binding factor RbfA [candidate division WOR-3 bacterium]
MKERKKRVANLIKETVTEIIQREIRDPKLGFLTITGVELGSDFKKAKFFFSVLGDEKVAETTLSVLRKAKGFIRHQLAQRISLKFVPELDFEIDRWALEERRVAEILKDLKREE